MAEPNILFSDYDSAAVAVGSYDTDDHGDQLEDPLGDEPASEYACPMTKNVHRVPSPADRKTTRKASELDVKFVNKNSHFDGTRDSEIELHHEVSLVDISLKENQLPTPPQEDVQNNQNVIHGLSKMFEFENMKEKLRQLSIDLNLNPQSPSKVDFGSAIFSDEAITREDTLSYHGYTIRTQGADVCISSVKFNQGGQKLQILVKIAEYDSCYRGTVTRIKSQPKILLDTGRWTMLYGSCEDDCLGVVEIELPPGVAASDIKCDGPSDGYITIDVPHSSDLSCDPSESSCSTTPENMILQQTNKIELE